MPLLGGLLVTLFSNLGVFFAAYLAKKVAFGLSAAISLGVLYGGLILFMNTTINPLVWLLFSTSYGQFLGLAFPPIAGTCFGIVSTIWAACMLYTWQKKALDAVIKA
jgi:hypothetical protein